MKITENIFKAYDIRGIVGRELNDSVIKAVGIIFGKHALKKNVKTCVVGRDGRHSGKGFIKNLVCGLRSVGIDVIDLGEVPTPVVYYGAHKFKTGTAVMITGSHNPSNYNGLKMMIAGKTLWGEDIEKIKKDVLRLENIDDSSMQLIGNCVKKNIKHDYQTELLKTINLSRPLKIAIDAGNGVAGEIAKDIYSKLGCEVSELFCDINGDFPNHHPDPADPKNLEDLIHKVAGDNLDIGLAFDGDGDRLGVVSNSGKIIWPDRQLMVYAREVLKHNHNSTIIFDVKCTQQLAPWIKKYNGQPLMWKTGHSIIKEKLKEIGSPLAGEMSGHIFFRDRWYGFDDAIYSGARLLEIISKSDDPKTYFNSIPESISTPELKLETTGISCSELVERIKSNAFFPTADNLIFIDGIRVEYSDGFGLARPSNTTPVVVFRFEGQSKNSLLRIQAEFKQILYKIDKELNLPF